MLEIVLQRLGKKYGGFNFSATIYLEFRVFKNYGKKFCFTFNNYDLFYVEDSLLLILGMQYEQ